MKKLTKAITILLICILTTTTTIFAEEVTPEIIVDNIRDFHWLPFGVPVPHLTQLPNWGTTSNHETLYNLPNNAGYTIASREYIAEALYDRIFQAGIELEEVTQCNFKDTKNPKIIALAKAGVLSGTSSTTFSPKGTMTRVQLSLLIDKLLNKFGTKLEGTLPPPFKLYEDDYTFLEEYEGREIPSSLILSRYLLSTMYIPIWNLEDYEFLPHSPASQENVLVAFENVFKRCEVAQQIEETRILELITADMSKILDEFIEKHTVIKDGEFLPSILTSEYKYIQGGEEHPIEYRVCATPNAYRYDHYISTPGDKLRIRVHKAPDRNSKGYPEEGIEINSLTGKSEKDWPLLFDIGIDYGISGYTIITPEGTSIESPEGWRMGALYKLRPIDLIVE